MSTAAVVPSSHRADHASLPGRPALILLEDSCLDCGRTLAEAEEHLCADCSDLAAHAWCRDCGAILADADLEPGACADCTA